MEIKYYNRTTGQIEKEKVYGESAVQFLYDSTLGRLIWPVVAKKWPSKIYGAIQSSRLSACKVEPFIKKFNIKMDEYELHENGTLEQPYPSFNDFFIRKFKTGKREFAANPEEMPAFSEARYLGWNEVKSDQSFPVKGSFISAMSMLCDKNLSKTFECGPLMIARLCPVDYHRFHFPDEGTVEKVYAIKGPLHSVNPLALSFKEDILCTNERVVSILNTKNFGKLAYIEVGATCVGRIVHSHDHSLAFRRGDEKGYFLFGGSTVIVLGERGRWTPAKDILQNTENKMETYIKLGDVLAQSTSS